MCRGWWRMLNDDTSRRYGISRLGGCKVPCMKRQVTFRLKENVKCGNGT
jgi:hypothetical protein